jgi:non-ribosomal peptide synthetase component F
MPAQQSLNRSRGADMLGKEPFSHATADSVNPAPTQYDLEQIWNWNASVPHSLQECVHDLITRIAKKQPDALAVCAWDGDFNYFQFDVLADEVARRLIGLGIAPKTIIPILFPKSRWTCVAMLGIIKAGCSAVALDHTQPDTRLRSIVQQVQPRTIISAPAHHVRARLLADVPVLQLDNALLETLEHSETSSLQLPIVSPSDIVYISFTS